MSLSSSTVWEVRPATGSDTACSGGFVTGASGTDYSQQNSAQYSLTGLTSSGTGAVILSASAANDMVGNLIQITSGTNFTTGFYQILSVSVGVSITVDRNVTSGVGAAGVGAIGGALATVSKAITASGINQKIYLKGTYTVTAIQVISQASDFNNPYTISGYSTARDDGTRATWTTATNSINLIDLSSACNVKFENIDFTNTAGTVGSGTTGNCLIPFTANTGTILISHCSFSGFNIAINGDWQNVKFTFNQLNLDNVEIKSSVSHGMINTASVFGLCCYFHDNGGDGYKMITSSNSNAGNAAPFFAHSVFYKNTGNGFTDAHNQITTNVPFTGSFGAGFVNCAFVSNTGDGVNGPANHTLSFLVVNCIFYGNSGWGWNCPTVNTPPNCIPRCNAFGSNTSGARQLFPVGVGDVALSADPFTAKASNDFSLNSTSGGGAACKTAGFPGVTAFGTGTMDIGPLGTGGGGVSTVPLTIQVQEPLWFS